MIQAKAGSEIHSFANAWNRVRNILKVTLHTVTNVSEAVLLVGPKVGLGFLT